MDRADRQVFGAASGAARPCRLPSALPSSFAIPDSSAPFNPVGSFDAAGTANRLVAPSSIEFKGGVFGATLWETASDASDCPRAVFYRAHRPAPLAHPADTAERTAEEEARQAAGKVPAMTWRRTPSDDPYTSFDVPMVGFPSVHAIRTLILWACSPCQEDGRKSAALFTSAKHG